MAYNRKYILTVTPITKDGNKRGRSIVIKDPITIHFDVRRMPMQGDSCATIDIHNLQPTTRNALFLDYFDFENIQMVTLEAGYQNGKFDLIYKGRIVTCRTRHELTENITRIEAQSGLYVLDSYISSSMGQGQYTEDVAKEAISKMTGVEKGALSMEAISIPRPVALVGNEMAVLQTYTKGNAIIDNERVIVIGKDQCIDGDVRVIDDETGLLGVPEREQVVLKVRCIFEPRIKVGQGLEIKSKIAPEFDGQYKVWGVSHSGAIGMAAGGQCITTIQLWTGLNLYGRFKSDFGKVVNTFPDVERRTINV